MKEFVNFIGAFSIGAVAGIAPFIVMQILPSLLNPGTPIAGNNTWALIVWGILIGLITAVFFGKRFNEKDPKDVFIQAIGIPAILLASITNLSIQMNANGQVEGIRTRANNMLDQSIKGNLNDVKINTINKPIPISMDQKERKAGFLSFFISKAFAETVSTVISNPDSQKSDIKQSNVPEATYIVSLGIYEDSAQAIKKYKDISEMKLITDDYITGKSLGVFKVPIDSQNSRYIIQYAKFNLMEKAVETQKRLHINDPSFDNVQVFKY